MISPRFFGNDTLESCLAGHRIFDGSGDPPEAVALVQQALVAIGFDIDVDGQFGLQTDSAVTDYKRNQDLIPNDPVIGLGTMASSAAIVSHELFDAKATELADTQFDLGARIGTRVDFVDRFANCDFENGICAEVGHTIAYDMPAAVRAAWAAAGGLDGMFGLPTSNPLALDATLSVQEFTFVAHIFDGQEDFTLPRTTWVVSFAGGAMIGIPLGSPRGVGEGGASYIPHERGVVLATPETSPQPLPQVIFDKWSAQEAAGASLGPPTAFACPNSSGSTFPFLLGSVMLRDRERLL